MINNVNYSPSFGTTYIPVKNMDIRRYMGDLPEYFNLKWFSPMKSQEAANNIEYGDAVFMFEDGLVKIVGKDGGPGGADTFIGRIMKKIHPDAKFVDDIKPSINIGEVIDLGI